MAKTLFVWDLADTLFYQKWNPILSGHKTIDEFLASRGVDLEDPLKYEQGHKEIFLNGELINLSLMPGFKEVLSQTHDNEAFTTGNREQVDWRAEYLNPKVGFDIRSLFKEIISTFDFEYTNLKTAVVFKKYFARKAKEDYTDMVYIDNNLENCQLAYTTAEPLFNSTTIFHCLNDKKGKRNKGWYFEIGELMDVIK